MTDYLCPYVIKKDENSEWIENTETSYQFFKVNNPSSEDRKHLVKWWKKLNDAIGFQRSLEFILADSKLQQKFLDTSQLPRNDFWKEFAFQARKENINYSPHSLYKELYALYKLLEN